MYSFVLRRWPRFDRKQFAWLSWTGFLLFCINVGDLRAEETAPPLTLPKIDGSTPQNVVIILIDDLRHDALRCTGHSFIDTPNIDRLAKDGIQFQNAFVTTSLCSPSRASILTGQYMHRHHVIDNNVPAPPGTIYFPQYLQKAGYQTAFLGKWHMGGGSDDPQPGFDHWVSFRGQGNYMSPGLGWKLNVDGKPVPQKGYITDELTDYAIDWLDKIDPARPFFLEISHKAVHGPFEPAARHKGRYKDVQITLPTLPEDWRTRDGVPMWVKNQSNSWHGVEFPYHSNLDFKEYYRKYCETLLAVDDSVGRVLDWIVKHGQQDKTVVLFMGDNGFFWGEHGLIDKRSAYEESMRVPLLVQASGISKGGRIDKTLVANIDLAPTILELAGLQPPKTMDGQSILPVLKGEEMPKGSRDYVLYEYYWEWNFPQTPTQFSLRTDRYKFIEYHGIWDTDELFDLEKDPGEQNNLIKSLDHQKIANQMRKRLHNVLLETEGKSMPIGTKEGSGAHLRSEKGSKAADFPGSIMKK